MGATAFTLREDYAGTVDQAGEQVPAFTGGLISIDEDRDLDLREALDEGNGFIVIDDSDGALELALIEVPVLKRVPVPEGADVRNPWLERNVRALRAEAKRRGIAVEAGVDKPAIAAGLLEHDRRLAAGDDVTPVEDQRTVTITAAGELDVVDVAAPDPDAQA